MTVYLTKLTKLNEIIWSIDDIWEGNGSSKRSKLLGTYALTNAIMDLSQMSVREKFRVWIRVQSWHKWDIRMFKTCNMFCSWNQLWVFIWKTNVDQNSDEFFALIVYFNKFLTIYNISHICQFFVTWIINKGALCLKI